MSDSGIVRNLDNLGRVVIPKEMRKLLAINLGDPVEIIKDKNTVVLKKYGNRCVFCDGEEELFKFKEAYVCDECGNNIMSTLK
ncbi:AbrB/MazE/SpoVT family DNA-binding domain-containing protein [Clostridium neonatale]|uniref:AbrB/MazE/SpoVT family DNA-binding domain-containing protein n=1 Tax=Clostridium neonatale TaxID=137838 RepID=UPI00291B80BB|nr:AbrB/MazE/SpoVT family DNA-binding domain-containing protein [Clostridium neonatale]CAI3206519.1 AbrB family transcriptional regulator, transcriptional pleiotropic regulator of transition state genes [Clostridium neonatale]CAI3210633.1 AbrB family transcriptional regulator, transcriptional pleiotropic regulator of transition state genes [Clostridium neonatale]CAI3676539.1 AbrB family transcriptional regulator, transcriptional pleiotropic regulator of transition state genes [Clostridium neonat